MAEKEDIKNEPLTSDPTQQPNGADQSEQPKKKRTVGNIVYDWGIYGSIAWAGVAALSLISSHEANHGTSKYFEWWRTVNKKFTAAVHSGLEKTIMKGKPQENIAGWAKGTAMFLTLGMGGTMLMGPLKWLEDNRQKNAAKIDNALGTTPPDPALVEKEPKQTWKSVLSGRGFSWGLSYVAFLAMGPKLADRISKSWGEAFTKQFMKWKPQANETSVRKWADIGAFDAVFTIITATLTYAFSRYIAKKDDKDLELEDAVVADNTTATMALEPEFYKSLENVKYPRARTAPVSQAASFSERIPSKTLLEHGQSVEAAGSSVAPSL